MAHGQVDRARDRDDASRKVRVSGRPVQNVRKRRSSFGWIPIDENKLASDAVTLRLLGKTVHKGLRPSKDVPAVVVVPRRSHEREQR
jgi:hypothetical protein